MKHVILATGLLAILCAAGGCGSTEAGSSSALAKSPYAGTWKGEDPFGQTMILTLKDDGNLTLQITGPRKSVTKRGTYSIDPAQSPAHFNIKLSDREINTIVKLSDENRRLTFESINSSDARPKSFGDQTIVMKRQ